MVKNQSASAGDMGVIPELGRSLGEGNGNPLQYSCLGNSTRGARQYTAHGVTKESDMTERLHFHFSFKKGVQLIKEQYRRMNRPR